MKKYVNGKIIEMTEADIAKRQSRISHRSGSRNNTAAYETKVKELEETISVLLTKLPQAE